MELIFATGNPHKLAEVQALLGPSIRLKMPADVGVTGEIPEEQATLEGNALQKARFLYERTGLDCFADDTGLEVEALDGAPGVYSARYAAMHGAGNAGDAAANTRLLLAELEGKMNRKARFRTVVALIRGGHEHLFEGTVEGEILVQPTGSEGFGYDPVFRPASYAESFAEMPLALKNSISHRGRAIARLADYLAR